VEETSFSYKAASHNKQEKCQCWKNNQL